MTAWGVIAHIAMALRGTGTDDLFPKAEQAAVENASCCHALVWREGAHAACCLNTLDLE